jgi:hypothetical protein
MFAACFVVKPQDWANFSRKRQCSVPKELLVASELKLSSGELQESDRWGSEHSEL